MAMTWHLKSRKHGRLSKTYHRRNKHRSCWKYFDELD